MINSASLLSLAKEPPGWKVQEVRNKAQATLTGFDSESPKTVKTLEVLERAKSQGMDVKWTVKGIGGTVDYEAGTPRQMEYMREQVAKWRFRKS